MALPFSNDAITFGILMAVLGTIMYTSNSDKEIFKRFYRLVPALVLCYFVPALLHWPLGIITSEGSNLYYMASRYLLPASLVLLCLSIDIPAIMRLGSKAIIMFFTATIGIVLGGPVALIVVLVAGSWIGGGANQTAMKEIYQVDDNLFATMIIVDILIGNTWIAILLYGVNSKEKIDRWLKSDTSAISYLEQKVEAYKASVKRDMTSTDIYVMAGVAFGVVGLSHLGSQLIVPFFEQYSDTLINLRLNSLMSGFFWLVVLATSLGFLLSFTPLRKLEGVGASSFGSFFIYILVATIGMQMNVSEIFENKGLFAVGLIWMIIHVTTLIVVAKIIKAPFFFIAVGSTANVGGAASAPVIANAFSPALAPVGALLAVLGYAAGTYGAIICATLMQIASGN